MNNFLHSLLNYITQANTSSSNAFGQYNNIPEDRNMEDEAATLLPALQSLEDLDCFTSEAVRETSADSKPSSMPPALASGSRHSGAPIQEAIVKPRVIPNIGRICKYCGQKRRKGIDAFSEHKKHCRPGVADPSGQSLPPPACSKVSVPATHEIGARIGRSKDAERKATTPETHRSPSVEEIVTETTRCSTSKPNTGLPADSSKPHERWTDYASAQTSWLDRAFPEKGNAESPDEVEASVGETRTGSLEVSVTPQKQWNDYATAQTTWLDRAYAEKRKAESPSVTETPAKRLKLDIPPTPLITSPLPALTASGKPMLPRCDKSFMLPPPLSPIIGPFNTHKQTTSPDGRHLVDLQKTQLHLAARIHNVDSCILMATQLSKREIAALEQGELDFLARAQSCRDLMVKSKKGKEVRRRECEEERQALLGEWQAREKEVRTMKAILAKRDEEHEESPGLPESIEIN